MGLSKSALALDGEAKQAYVMQPRGFHGTGRGLGMVKPLTWRLCWNAVGGYTAYDDYEMEHLIIEHKTVNGKTPTGRSARAKARERALE